MRKYPSPSESDKERYDGASLPKPYRWWLKLTQSQKTIEEIDDSGDYHDHLIENLEELGITIEEARNEFIIDLIEKRIPHSVIRDIWAGIYYYDKSPMWLQKLLKKI